MKRVNLSKESPSINELLIMARDKSLLLVADDGTTYLLEEADNFDQEAAQLGSSPGFMKFLAKRSKERGVISIERFAQELTGKKPGDCEVSSGQKKKPAVVKKRTKTKLATKK